MAGYSKNTISVQPQTKPQYYLGDTVVFRLPTNSILDLHTLTLKFAGQLVYSGSNQNGVMAQFPRFTQSYFRRKDRTMAGMQAGCGSLHDYNGLYNLLGAHKIPLNRCSADLNVTDNANYVPLQSPVTKPTIGAQLLYTAGTSTGPASPWTPVSVPLVWASLLAASCVS